MLRKYIHIKSLIIIIIVISTFFVFNKYKTNEKNDIFIPVLMYHNLNPRPDFKKITYTIKPEMFSQHMNTLKNSGYNTITISELNEFLSNNVPLPKKPIIITFDDGKTNNYDFAYPILKDLDMKGNIFVIVHAIEDDKNKEYLDWTRLKEMHDESVMDIQSHTYDLHHKIDNKSVIFKHMDGESKEDYQDKIMKDFRLSKQLIEMNVGNKVIALAYPYGGCDKDIDEIAKQSGYLQLYTTNTGMMKKSNSPCSIKRLNVDGLCSKNRLLFEIFLLKVFSSIF